MRSPTTWSVADYQRMRISGILDRRRCELIDGEIWDMAPEGAAHRFINDRGAEYLRRQLQGQAKVFEAHPITLARSEPQPDIAIVRLPETRYLDHHPYPDDIYWLVEVADTTLAYDLETKRQLYAQAGILEYWVIHVVAPQMTVFRDGQAGDFATQIELTEGLICPTAFPQIAIDVTQLIQIPR